MPPHSPEGLGVDDENSQALPQGVQLLPRKAKVTGLTAQMESRNQLGVEVTWEIDGQQDTLEASVMVDRQWRDKSTGGMVWGSEQTVEGKALTFANSDEGRGFRELVGQFARRDLLV